MVENKYPLPDYSELTYFPTVDLFVPFLPPFPTLSALVFFFLLSPSDFTKELNQSPSEKTFSYHWLCFKINVTRFASTPHESQVGLLVPNPGSLAIQFAKVREPNHWCCHAEFETQVLHIEGQQGLRRKYTDEILLIIILSSFYITSDFSSLGLWI